MDAEWEDELSAGLEVQLETLESLDGSVDASMGAAGMSIGLDDEGGDGPTAPGPLLVAGGSGGSEDDAMSVGGAGSVRSGDDGWFSDGDVDATVMVTSPRGNSEGAHGAEDSNTAGVEGAGVAAGEAHGEYWPRRHGRAWCIPSWGSNWSWGVMLASNQSGMPSLTETLKMCQAAKASWSSQSCSSTALVSAAAALADE